MIINCYEILERVTSVPFPVSSNFFVKELTKAFILSSRSGTTIRMHNQILGVVRKMLEVLEKVITHALLCAA